MPTCNLHLFLEGQKLRLWQDLCNIKDHIEALSILGSYQIIQSGKKMLKYLTAWFLMLLVFIINGTVRDFTYGQHMDELTAHQISTISGVLLLSIIIWGYVRLYRFSSGQEAVLIGLLWMVLTITFELLFFHYVGGHSWSELFANYNIFKGRVWVVILAWVAIAPYLFFRFSRPT